MESGLDLEPSSSSGFWEESRSNPEMNDLCGVGLGRCLAVGMLLYSLCRGLVPYYH